MPGREAARGLRFASSLSHLEIELQSQLHEPWRACPFHTSEIRAVRDVAIGVEELRVIRKVEDVPAKFHPSSFCNLRALLERNIRIIQPGPAADATRSRTITTKQRRLIAIKRRARRARRGTVVRSIRGEAVLIESVVVGVFAWIQFVKTRDLIWLASGSKINTAGQFVVVKRLQMDWETSLELRDSGNRPAI